MIQKKEDYQDTSRISENMLNNNSTFISNTNGSISYRQDHQSLIQVNTVESKKILKECSSTHQLASPKTNKDLSSFKQQSHKNSEQSFSIQQFHIKPFYNKQIRQNKSEQNAQLNHINYKSLNQERNDKNNRHLITKLNQTELNDHIQNQKQDNQYEFKQKIIIKSELTSSRDKDISIKKEIESKDLSKQYEIKRSSLFHVDDIKDPHKKYLSPRNLLKPSQTERAYLKSEISPAFQKFRRKAAFQAPKKQKIFCLQDTFERVQEIFDTEKKRYKQIESTESKINTLNTRINTCTRILDNHSSISSDNLSTFNQKVKTNYDQQGEEYVDPQQSIFFSQLSTGNLQSLLNQSNLQQLSHARRKVNLHQMSVEYAQTKEKTHSPPIALHTFDEIKATQGIKSKKYILNSYKQDKYGLQTKIKEQANNFLNQLSCYNYKMQQQEIDSQYYTSNKMNIEDDYSISQSNISDSQVHINHGDEQNLQPSLYQFKNLPNNKYKSTAELSQFQSIHLPDISIDSKQANKKKQKLGDSQIFEFQQEINKHQIFQKAMKIYKKKDQKLYKQDNFNLQIKEKNKLNDNYVKRNILEDKWPHQEQKQGDNSFHSFTEAQLDTYYNHSQSIQKSLLSDPNPQKSIKNLLKLEFYYKQISF